MLRSWEVSALAVLRALGGRTAAAATLWAALFACRNSAGGPAGEGTVIVRAQALGAGAPVDRFEITASPSGRAATLLADSTGAFRGSLSLPAGSQILDATAYAGAARVGAASAKVQVVAGQSADVLLRVRGDQLPARTLLITSLVASPAHALTGQAVFLSATADAGGDPVAFSWADDGCGTFASPAADSTTWSRATPGTCLLTAVARTAAGEDSQSISVAVTAPHPAPVITSFTASAAAVAVGQVVSLSATADAGGDPVAFGWKDRACGDFSSPSTASTIWLRSSPGVCTLTLTATSQGGEDSRSVTVTVGAPHDPPTIAALVASPTRVVAGRPVSLTASASAGADPVAYAWSDQGCGSFSSTAGAATIWSRSSPGTCLVTVTATSLGGYVSRSVSVVVTGAHPAASVAALEASPSRVIAGQSTALTATADAGGDPITFAWSDGGCGVFSSTAGAKVSWSRSTPGTCTLTVTATAQGGSDSKSVTVSVVPPLSAPTIITSFDVPASAIAGQSVAVSATASAGQDPVTYTWTDQGCGTFARPSSISTTWSRSTPGACTLTVTATSPGGSASKSATISVRDAPPAGTLVRTGLDSLPAPPNGRTAIAPDRCAMAMIRRDRNPVGAGDLFSFFRASAERAGDAWYLMTSPDGGTSWTWFSAQSGSEPNPLSTYEWNHDSTLTQDSVDYKVHHMYWRSGQSRAEYNRIALSYDANGHIAGWSWEVENVAGPAFNTRGSNGGYAKMTLNEAVDGNGQKILVLFAVDQPSSTRIARLVATRTAAGTSALKPTSASSWKKLTDAGATGYDVLGAYNSDDGVDSTAMANFMGQPADSMQQHTTDHCWQQLSADGSLHAFFGPYYYNDQTTTGQIRRWRLTRSGADWVVDASANGAEVSSADGTTRPQMGGCYASPSFVWLTYGKPGAGLVVDKVGISGAWVSNALPSPDPTGAAWWYAAVSVRDDEASAFLLWERWSMDVRAWREYSGYYDGKEWKVVDESASWNANGYNGAANWLHGAWPDGLTVLAYPYSDWASSQRQRHHSHTLFVQP